MNTTSIEWVADQRTGQRGYSSNPVRVRAIDPRTGKEKVYHHCVKQGPECLSVVAYPLPQAVMLQRIMPPDVLTRAAHRIVFGEGLATTTSAGNNRVGFARLAAVSTLAMLRPVMRYRRYYFKIFGAIIRLVAIEVVNQFALLQRAAQYLGRYKPMLIDIAAHIGQRVAGPPEQYVAVGGDTTPAAPVWITVPRMYNSHASE